MPHFKSVTLQKQSSKHIPTQYNLFLYFDKLLTELQMAVVQNYEIIILIITYYSLG